MHRFTVVHGPLDRTSLVAINSISQPMIPLIDIDIDTFRYYSALICTFYLYFAGTCKILQNLHESMYALWTKCVILLVPDTDVILDLDGLVC